VSTSGDEPQAANNAAKINKPALYKNIDKKLFFVFIFFTLLF
jgi:hypothetical protein